jgi:4-diphosphocytidyl-2-C-methyl-D-erythritol kinase
MSRAEPRARGARVIAQAKINLFLHVLARESSGYHGIETLFQRLELGDEVRVRLTDGERSLDCGGPAMPARGLGPVESNLAWRAAVAYQGRTGFPRGFEIEIEKHVPVGGGLGGGSADAAAVLRALDALAPTPLGETALLALASSLGADVPFLASRATRALAWGRGERLLALPALAPASVELLTFATGVETASAYRWMAEDRAIIPRGTPAARELHSAAFDGWSGLASLASNDFEPVVLTHHQSVSAALPLLRDVARQVREVERRAAFALMSGSGATLFLLHDSASGAPMDGEIGRRASELAHKIPGCAHVGTRTATEVRAVELLD